MIPQKPKVKHFESAFSYAIHKGISTPLALWWQHEIDALDRAASLRKTRNDDLIIEPHQATTQTIVQMQGSVLRVKTSRTVAQKGRVFERGWNDSQHDEITKPQANKHAITEFSSSSRRTLQDKLMSLSDNALVNCKFVTLTYHEQIPSPERAKEHIRAFYKRVVRYALKRSKIYKPAMFWRIEVNPRQSGENYGQAAPHFHLFLFGIPFIPQHFLLKWWREITGDETINQLDIKRLDNRRKVMNYVSKYVSKKPKAGDVFAPLGEGRYVEVATGTILDIALYLAAVGRWWGFEGAENIPFAEIIEVRFSWLDRLMQEFVRTCEGKFAFLNERWSAGFRVFFFDPDARDYILSYFDQLIPDFASPVWGWKLRKSLA